MFLRKILNQITALQENMIVLIKLYNINILFMLLSLTVLAYSENARTQQNSLKMTAPQRETLDLPIFFWRQLTENNRQSISINHSVPSNESLELTPLLARQQNSVFSGFPKLGKERPFLPSLILRPRQMFQLLGAEAYNPEFTSYSKPWDTILYPQGHLQVEKARRRLKRKFKRSAKTKSSLSELAAVLQTRLNALQLAGLYQKDDRNKPEESILVFAKRHAGSVGVARRRRRRIARNVADYSVCPVWWTWKDYGSHFWPRWVKEGQCVDVSGTSCSLPTGMYCVEDQKTVATILRYICPVNWPQKHCQWYRIRFSLLSSCRCGCESFYKSS